MTTHFNIYDFCDCLLDVFFSPVESLMFRDHTGMPARAGMGSLQRVHGHGPSSTFLFFFYRENVLASLSPLLTSSRLVFGIYPPQCIQVFRYQKGTVTRSTDFHFTLCKAAKEK